MTDYRKMGLSVNDRINKARQAWVAIIKKLLFRKHIGTKIKLRI